MGKNRKRGKGKGKVPPPGAGPPCHMRPAAPSSRGGFPAPVRSMGPPGPRCDFRPQNPRMMRMDNMEGDRRFMHETQGFIMHDEPFHQMQFPDRQEFRPPFNVPDPRFQRHAAFGIRPPAQRFYRPELECGPRFPGRPPLFRPSEFAGDPGFQRINPGFEQMEQYGPRDPHFVPQMDVHGNHAFGERGGFAAPAVDFRGPGSVHPPPEAFNAASVPLPGKACPPQPQNNQPAPKETQAEPAKSMASKISTFKNISANTPRGRSLGVISFIGNNCGFIEREDLKKFSFVFDSFLGNRAHLVPGVKVHFTAVKNLGKECAVEVKVAPGGTDDIDSVVYEGVVLTVIPEGNVKEVNPGRIRTIISSDTIKLPFGKEDTDITLLLYDRVEFQLLTNVITKEQRATNIKPKTPDTFQLTKEIREMGVVLNKSDGTLTIMTEKHDNLTASAADHLSDDELNVMDEVELTVLTVNDTKKAVRLKKLPEGSVSFNEQAKGNDDKWKPVTMVAGSQESAVDVSTEKYEGTISKIAPKKSPTQEKEQMDKQEPTLGLLVTTVEGTEKRLSFRSGDVITKATMMTGDKVKFNISTNSLTKEQWAVNVEILPESFQTESEEQRKIGLVVKLDDNCGFIKTQQDPQLFFDLSEVMEDTKLALSEKVEFTLVPIEAPEGGNRAVRIRRLKESVFTSAAKLEAFGVKEKKKMTIKLLKDPKEQIKEDVKTEDKSNESMDVVKPNKGKDEASPILSSVRDLKKESEIKQERSIPVAKGDRVRSRSRENSRRRYSRSRSRSRSRENGRRRYSRSRSRSHERNRSYHSRHRSSSRERRDGRYRHKRSRSKERSERSRRSGSRSRSRERSTQSSRKRSHSPVDRYGRCAKQSSSKDSGNKNKAKSPDNVDEELVRKKRELMELNEMIARKKAIVAMEQNAKKIEPEVEVDGKSGVTTFDYQHVHRENVWMPDLKPMKSILKKQSEPHTEHQSQASASKETTAPFLKSESQEMQMGYRQQNSPYGSNTPGCSRFESNSETTLTSAWSEKISLPQIQDSELVRKKKKLEELSESIARKRAIFALEQKVNVVREMPEMEKEYEFDSNTDDKFVMSKGNFWSSEIKPDAQPKKSILKKRSEMLSTQTDTTSVDEYGQQFQDDSTFSKRLSQTTDALPFNRLSNPQLIHPGGFSFFKQMIAETSAASQVSESPPFNKLVIPQPITQASSSRSLHDKKSSNVSKGNSCHDDQQRATSRQPQDHPHSSNPSTSQTSPSGQKRNLTTQMERFLTALNKADTSVVNSLFQEARKVSMNTKTSTQPQLDRNIPFMDEIYDPFKEDEEIDQPSFKHSGQERVKSLVKTETRFSDPSKDDLLPHERAVQDGSGFSQLVGMKYGVDPTSKVEQKSAYGHPMVSENWNMHKGPNRFSEQWNQYEESPDPYATEHEQYVDHSLYNRERSQSVEYQKVNPNIPLSCLEDRKMPDSNFDKSLARQQSEESNEDKERKSENFEKIQSLLQTIGLNLDTAEVSKLADRTQERLYGKMRKPHSASTYSFEQRRERSVSQSEQRGSSSRADSSDSEGVRSVSPAQSSNRKVYMSYKDSVKYKDQRKVEDVDLTSIKRTVMNLKTTKDKNDPYETLSEPTAVSQVSFQPAAGLITSQPDSSQFAQNPSVPTFSASQYSQYSQYQSSDQQFWGVTPGLYSYGTVPPSSNVGYASGLQAMAPHMMAAYSSYTAQLANPYNVPPPLSMPYTYGPPSIQNPLHLSSMGTSKAVKQQTKPVRCLKTIKTVQTVKEVSASALVSIQPTDDNQAKSTLEDAKNKQVATITEDDLKAKQKKRLEQFNQRMKLKKEQQMEAQRARGQNRNSATGKSSPSEIKNVWICGHSLVFWAEKRATSPEFGVQLGMHPNCVRVWWKGVQGMTWQQIVPLLHQLKDNWPKPDVLIIHLGGNDISTTAPEAFIETVKKDMTSLKSIFPQCLLVWSSILSRQSWRGTEDSKEMDIIRSAINNRIQEMMPELGGSALSHSNIRAHLGHYRPDGVHLSGKGIDIFNLNLQAFLEKWEHETNKTETSDPSV